MNLKEEDTKSQDMDELLDSDEDYDDDSFKISGALNYPEAYPATMQELHSQIHDGAIDLEPDWQRAVVWSDAKQSQLIHSIFHNYYIPPVVFATTQDLNESVLVCVDGKQRLSSILRFIDGKIPYRDQESNVRWWYTTPTGGERKEIPPAYKKYFDDKILTCVRFSGLDDGTIRNMFQLVQLGVSLTSAEKLQAIHSGWGLWINSLLKQHVEVGGGLKEILEWDTKRGRDYQCLAQLVCCCEAWPEKVNPSTSKVVEFMGRSDEPRAQFKKDIDSTLRLLWSLATEPKFNDAFTKIDARRLAPVEFVFIGVLLYVMRDQSKKDCADAIYNLRLAVRQEHADIRANTRIFNSLWKLVSELETNPRHVATKRKRKSKTGEDGGSPKTPKKKSR